MSLDATTTEFRVLIVDDDADLAANLRDILEDAGYFVTVANDGRSALARCREQAYDLALVDIRMPDMSGLDLVESCLPVSPETEFIMVTGHATLDTAITAVKHERVIGYETKPVDVDRLVSMIGQVRERRRAEDDLRASEAVNRAIVNAVPDMMFRVSRDGRYLDVVPGHGVTPLPPPEQVLGRRIADVMPQEVASDQMRRIEDALATGIVQTAHYRLEVDGHLRDYETRFVAIGEDEVLAIARDTTERVSSERAMRESEERFRTIFEWSPTGIVITGQSGRILAANPAFQSMLGYSREELLGMTVADISHPGELPENLKLLDEVVRGERDRYEIEKRYYHQDGRIIWGDLVVSAVRDADGHFQYCVAIVNDVTARKRIEGALRDSERNFRNSLDDSPLGVRIVSAHGELLYANRAILDMYGYEDVDRLRNTPTRERYVREAYAEHVDRREKRRRGEYVSPEYEIRILRSDGEVRHLSVMRKAVVWDGEERFQVLYQDVTELKKTQEQLQHSQLLASLGEMTAGIAHEVNNPLGSVLLYSELLLAGEVPPQTKKDLRVIRDEARRASRIMSDLLTYGRRATTSSRRTDVHRVIRKVLDMRRYEQRVVDITVEDDLAAGPLYVKGNVSQLTQLFVNLILNAEEALAEGNGSLIRLSSRIEGDWARISVIDDGTGIPEELLNQVFYPFFTTRHADKGTGLGLSACYGIVTAHNGLISVENNEIGGATLIVELPLDKPRTRRAPAGKARQARSKRN